MHNTNHYLTMFIIMLLAGLLSTMNVWVDKLSDIRYGINDFYMIFLMTGWMFLFMGYNDNNNQIMLIGLATVIIFIYLIRTQMFVNQNQYIKNMIPHHSMAIHMSKKLLKKDNNIDNLLNNIIETQINEIKFMKEKEK